MLNISGSTAGPCSFPARNHIFEAKNLYLMRIALVCTVSLIINSCFGQMKEIKTGADQTGQYLPLIQGKHVAIVANQTSIVEGVHLVDTLLSLQKAGHNFSIEKVFAPEHGFRGDIDDGVAVADQTDSRTGIPLISVYGRNKKPSDEQLADVDAVIFDIQDVGVRFYTFISTMHYVMEACAENGIPVILLDRPNPNGNYIDGPVLSKEFSSFVGMHPIPVVHGLTMGELAGMINGEGWLRNGVECNITVVPCRNYTHHTPYDLPVKPSPNLPNNHSVKIYPSTCFFEGTVISEGRGTMHPFEVYGHPELPGEYAFVPRSIKGMDMHPKFRGDTCYGRDLRKYNPPGGWNRLELKWLLEAYNAFPDKQNFFKPFFDLLAGTDRLKKQVINGWSEQEIRQAWEQDLNSYKKMRENYLLYAD